MPSASPRNRRRSMAPSGYASIARPGFRSVRSWSGPGARVANVTWVVTVSPLGSPSVAGSSPSKAIGFGSTACMGRGWSGSPRTLARRSPVAWSRQVERCATRPVRKADTFQTRTPRSGNDRMDKASVGGVEVRSPVAGQDDSLFTTEALEFLGALHRRFDGGRRDLLRQRVRRQEALDRGETLDFLPETRAIREGSWSIAPVPSDLQDRRAAISGPEGSKLKIHALYPGARGFLWDVGAARTRGPSYVGDGQWNLI